MAPLPVAVLGRAIAPAALGGALTIGFKHLEAGMRARTEALAFFAEVDIFCARADSMLFLAKRHETRHLEAGSILELLCGHAEALMDRMECTNDEEAQAENRAKLTCLMNSMKEIHSVFRESSDKLRKTVLQLEFPANGCSGRLV